MTERDTMLAAEFVSGLLDPHGVLTWNAASRQTRHSPACRAMAGPARRPRSNRTRHEARSRSVATDREPDRHGGAPQRTPGRAPCRAVEFHRRIARGRGRVACRRTDLCCDRRIALNYATREAARKPVYVAILVNDDTKQPGAVVNAFANGRVEMIPLTDINVPPGRALEIWTLWDRDRGPRSVGLIDRAQTVRLNLDKLPPTGPDQLFEITLEPAGGSPIGRPTGRSCTRVRPRARCKLSCL